MPKESKKGDSSIGASSAKKNLCHYDSSDGDEPCSSKTAVSSSGEKTTKSCSSLLKDELRRRIAQEQEALNERETQEQQVEQPQQSSNNKHHKKRKHNKERSKSKERERRRSRSKEKKRSGHSGEHERREPKRHSDDRRRNTGECKQRRHEDDHKRRHSETGSFRDERRHERQYDDDYDQPRRRHDDRKPSYLNRRVIAHAEQIQKRKLLWQKGRDTEKTTQSSANWESMMAASGSDPKSMDKFKKLMGIKNQGGASATSDISEQRKKQESLYNSLDQQYQVARMSTHTMRGVGLGFSSQFTGEQQ